MLGSMAIKEMVPIGVGAGFVGVLLSGAVSVVVAGLTSVLFSDVSVGAGGRQMIHPIRHFSRNSRQLLALAAPCGMGMKGTAFW